MGILTSLFGQIDRSPTSDYWYTPVGTLSTAGITVTEDQVLKISPVLQGVRFLSQTVAGLPRFVFRHLEDGRSREKDTKHHINRILRYQPNPWQTSFQFVEQLTAHAMLKRFGIAEKVYNAAGQLEALLPLEPSRVAKIEQVASGKLRYTYRRDNGSARTLMQDELFVIPGFGLNGISGLPLIDQMRETAGLTVATEKYGARFFANSAMPRVVLTSPKAVSERTRANMKADWNRTYGGEGQHGTALLEDDTKVAVLSTKNDEAQFIELKRFLIAEYSRYMDVTPHRLSDLEKASYNNVEHMSLETVVYSLTPWVRRWEQCCYRDLLSEEDKEEGRFIEFILEGLLRGDTAARSQFYKDGINSGWLTRNEVREKENHNPLDGLDDPLQPQNMAPVGQGGTEPATTEMLGTRAYAIARAAAQRIVSREVKGISKWSERKTGDVSAWRQHVEQFYAEHAHFVEKNIATDAERAKNYCDVQCAIVLKFGPDAVNKTEDWCNGHAVAFLVEEALKP